jgi:hypothetical protein
MCWTPIFKISIDKIEETVENSISLIHIYMIAHFSGFVQAFKKK